MGIHSGSRLVEHKQVRFGRQSPGNLQPALIAVSHGSGNFLAASLEPDEFEKSVGAFGNRLFFGLLKLARITAQKKPLSCDSDDLS